MVAFQDEVHISHSEAMAISHRSKVARITGVLVAGKLGIILAIFGIVIMGFAAKELLAAKLKEIA